MKMLSDLNPHYGLTDEYRARVLSLARTYPVVEVARQFQLSRSVIYQWRQRMKIAPNTVVSSGTQHLEDLMPRFIEALGPFIPAGLKTDAEKWLAGEYIGDNIQDFARDFAVAEILGELQDELELLSPPRCYFGAHPGDGACFGFWEYENV